MSIFSTLKATLSLKEKLIAGVGIALFLGIVISGIAWEHRQLMQATENIGRLNQVISERDAVISLQNKAMTALNDAQRAFHAQEVKDDDEQSEFVSRQEQVKSDIRKEMDETGTIRQRLPDRTRSMLQRSIREFNADAGKG
ncbi:ppfA [Citrobacter werkmanii]|uniref:ppfA n=1 Tax=Citrobacter werkmanii TaxID=67827 RepID=UPI003463EB61